MIPIPSRRKKLASEPDFERPPLWIHGIVAGILAPEGAERKYVSSKREAKRRELLRLLDRIPIPAGGAKPAKRSQGTAQPAQPDLAAPKPPSGRPSATRR
jgi:hypothetical protein